MPTDEFRTIEGGGEGTYSEKRSRFLAFSHHVETAGEAMDLLAAYRKRFYDARHVCYAYMLGPGREEFRSNDDGEPSGTAGRPILGQINSNGLTDVLVVVVRYFGGVKLGTSGLIQAYRAAAAAAIGNSRVVSRLVEEVVTFEFPYVLLNDVMRIVKDMGPRIVSQEYGESYRMGLSIRASQAGELRGRLEKARRGY